MVLTQSGQWVPVQSLYSLDPAEAANGGSGPTSTTMDGPSLARKWAMGFVWIVLAGWLGMGTLFALLHEVLSALSASRSGPSSTSLMSSGSGWASGGT